MEGNFYSTENFDYFRDMMRIKFHENLLSQTENMDIYNLFSSSITVTKNPYKGVLVIPASEFEYPYEKVDEKTIKSHLEKITRSKLTEVKSNGN